MRPYALRNKRIPQQIMNFRNDTLQPKINFKILYSVTPSTAFCSNATLMPEVTILNYSTINIFSLMSVWVVPKYNWRAIITVYYLTSFDTSSDYKVFIYIVLNKLTTVSCKGIVLHRSLKFKTIFQEKRASMLKLN